ncbi:MAG TPA: aminotransferase class V-fold PLP-dependent enzyme [Conexibacter sp.]|nr:aminotransferase class V-fold PLP-dependent enzyme [Conexibacter sp.]
MSAAVDHARWRERFPVLDSVAYLNAGTGGPLPAAAAEAVAEEVTWQARSGRSLAYMDRRDERVEELRMAFAALIGAAACEVAVTTSTSEGIARVLHGLELRAGDEVLVSDEEHPALLGCLADLRDRVGIAIRAVAAEEIAATVTPATKLVACSHVSWLTGRLAPPQLARLDVPVLLDGAQAAGAIPVDVAALGCDFYAAPGHKWLCGPAGTGLLFVAPKWHERLAAARAYNNLHDPADPLHSAAHPDARAFDTPTVSLEAAAGALAALGTLAELGWSEVHARGRALAAWLRLRLRDDVGVEPIGPGGATLVAWPTADAAATRRAFDARSIAVRELGDTRLRASTGAWNSDADLDALVAALGSRAA